MFGSENKRKLVFDNDIYVVNFSIYSWTFRGNCKLKICRFTKNNYYVEFSKLHRTLVFTYILMAVSVRSC